jgi:SAM-dependent methyltransferase
MSSHSDNSERLARHYAVGAPDSAGAELLERLRLALAEAGLDLNALQPTDLNPIDQFHSRGRPATLDLARRAGVAPGQRVLDIGGGLGGGARTLAAEFGCEVVVLDLTPAYIYAGEALTRMVGLQARVTFRQGNALEMAEPDESFDVVWTQHSTMNIPDKPRLYAEARRVLRRGGRLALHEIVGGPESELSFPVPWATDPADSYLLPEAELRAVIAAAGFTEVEWVDETEQALAAFQWLTGALSERGGQPFTLGLHLMLGPTFPAMIANLTRSLAAQKVKVIQAVFQRD